MITLGFDPGGLMKFGCAAMVAERDGLSVLVGTVSSVDEVFQWLSEIDLLDKPKAAGVDTLLFWQSTPSGWRGADEWLQSTYPNAKKSVVASNGLYGSMSVQGALLAARLRESFPSIYLTETHPKVLWHHFNASEPYPRDWSAFDVGSSHWCREIGLMGSNISNDHEFDAAISAWAALKAVTGCWPLDLYQKRARCQRRDNISTVPDVHYNWPRVTH